MKDKVTKALAREMLILLLFCYVFWGVVFYLIAIYDNSHAIDSVVADLYCFGILIVLLFKMNIDFTILSYFKHFDWVFRLFAIANLALTLLSLFIIGGSIL